MSLCLAFDVLFSSYSKLLLGFCLSGRYLHLTLLYDVLTVITLLIISLKILCSCILVCEAPSITIIIVGVIIGILVGGLTVLFIWKAYVTVHDQREYARFEEERKLTSFGTVIFLFVHIMQQTFCCVSRKMTVC